PGDTHPEAAKHQPDQVSNRSHGRVFCMDDTGVPANECPHLAITRPSCDSPATCRGSTYRPKAFSACSAKAIRRDASQVPQISNLSWNALTAAVTVLAARSALRP